MNPDPLMLQEAREAPEVVRRLLRENAHEARRVAAALAARPPRFAVTVARGSSDHAANVLKYALETQLGLSVAGAAPSVTTVYGRAMHLEGALVLAVSQSGASPDVVETVAGARAAGALTLAMVNQPDSPLSRAAEFTLPLWAGEERAVAATKSFVASLVAGLQLLACLKPDPALDSALETLPRTLEEALGVEETARARAERYRYAQQMIVLGRGLHFGVALEAALKLKETCGIQAEAYSSAEFAHGPVRIVDSGFPVVAFQSRDQAAALTLETYRGLEDKEAELLLIGADAPLQAPVRLLTPPSGHRLTDPAASILALYLLAGHLALARGLDPDAPPSLRKVTLTR